MASTLLSVYRILPSQSMLNDVYIYIILIPVVHLILCRFYTISIEFYFSAFKNCVNSSEAEILSVM